MKTLIWSPDTCGCQLKLEYDETQANPTYTLKEMVKTCNAHTVLAENQKLDVAFDENHLKNETMTILRDTVPEITEIDDRGRKILRDGEVSFRFEGTAPNRTLRVTTKTDISAYEQEIRDAVASAGQSVEL